jgi:hypothetical protein
MPQNFISAQGSRFSTLTTVYNPTTAGVQATMTGCLICNLTTGTVTVSVTLVNSGATVITNIVKNVIIPIGTSLDIMNSAKINVPQNYAVQVVASDVVDVTISAVEVS